MTTHDYKTGLQEIGDGVYAYIREGIGWDICNSGLIVGDEECLVVDAMMVGGMVRTFLEDVRKVTDKPVRYVVDTHHHADHAFGNQFYRPVANILGPRGLPRLPYASGRRPRRPHQTLAPVRRRLAPVGVDSSQRHLCR